jgi:hypothetical protein
MRGDSLGFACSLEHEELGEDGYALEKDGEGPEDLSGCEGVVKDESEDEAGADEIFDAEGIDGGVVCRSVQRV